MIKLFKKDLILFFNDRRSFSLTFLIPVILITLFAFAYGGVEKYTGKSDNFNLLVSDMDSSILSIGFINKIDSVGGIETRSVKKDEAISLINDGKYACCLVFKPGFSESIMAANGIKLELIYDREQNFEVGMLQSLLINTLISYRNDLLKDTYPLQAYKQSINETESIIEMTSIVGDKQDLNLGLIQAVAGTAILMLLFSVAGIGTSILEEKENGTISRLLFSPLKLNTILLSKMLFAFFISVLQLSIMFIYAWLFLELDIGSNPTALILMIFATSLAVSSLGIFLAAIAKSRAQAFNLSTIFILVMSAIGGSMIPLFIMPDIMEKIAILSVNYWSIQGFYDIFWRLLPLSEIIPEILVLSLTGIVLSIISLRLFSKNILKII